MAIFLIVIHAHKKYAGTQNRNYLFKSTYLFLVASMDD
jgi:hypothetical protein